MAGAHRREPGPAARPRQPRPGVPRPRAPPPTDDLTRRSPCQHPKLGRTGTPRRVAAAWHPIASPWSASVSATGAAVIDLLVVRHPGQATQALVWLSGSTYGRAMDEVMLLAWFPILLVPLLVLSGRHLDLLGVGDDGARTLGLSVERARVLAVVLACALAAAAVGIVGNLGFVGLLGPHLARPLTGPGHRRFLPVAALLGALVVVVADALGRSLFAPTELPVGLVVSLVGTPFFLHLIWRTRTVAAG
ncbi:MAG: iron ABC transporter permease [Acidimicrobiales bacterium]|nr:iron ABC transporter permease [Acidimicrobiales bacterium]